MANTSSAKKAIRVSGRKTKINARRKIKLKESIKSIQKAVVKSDLSDKNTLLTKAYKEIDKSAKRNIINKTKAARMKSNLAKKLR